MLRAAADAGTRVIASTPHLRSDFPGVHLHELADRCDSLGTEIARAEIPVEVVCGAETSLTWAVEADEEELRLASYGQRGGDLLIETPSMPVAGLDRFFHGLQLRGYRITLAHPERSAEFQRDIEPLRELVKDGLLLQVNAESLAAGRRRSGSRDFAARLCSEGLAQVLASDGHRASSWRPVTSLPGGLEALSELVVADRADWMVRGVPRAIVDGDGLPPEPPVQSASRGSRLFRRARRG